MKKKVILCGSLFGVLAFSLLAGLASIKNGGADVLSRATPGSEVHSDTLAITDMSKITSNEVYTKDGNKITFVGQDGGFTSAGVLTNGKKLYNETIINGLTSVTVATTGNIKILGGWYQSGSTSFAYLEDEPVASGTGTVVANFGTSSPGYFAIVADGADATLTSISIGYECIETKHTLTLHLYTTNNLNEGNTNALIDSNWTINNQWINENASWSKMTYVGQEDEYYHFSYSTTLPYGLVRFQFALRDTGDTYTSTISKYDSWKPYSFYLTGDTTWYCYCDDGFPENGSRTNVFEVYSSKLDNPYKTTFNVTFADGSSDFTYVGLKTDLTGSYAYTASLAKNDSVWSYTLKSGETQSYYFFIEFWVTGFDGNGQLVKSTSPWSGFNLTITSNESVAVVNIVVGTAITVKGDYIVSPTGTNCTIN